MLYAICFWQKLVQPAAAKNTLFITSNLIISLYITIKYPQKYMLTELIVSAQNRH